MAELKPLTGRVSMELRLGQQNSKMADAAQKPQEPNWWKTATCYQVWPASFKDSDGDGLGDIPGILSKLDYLHDLGVDVVWLSPMYASPQVDMGYDISDFNAIYPPYGTMDDMDELIAGLHNRGMRLLLDLVINHTSDEHHWFQESRKSRDNKYSDYYMWKDPKVDENGEKGPPNNWGSFFGGSAWEYVAERDQYYLHIFTKEQPDLNWEDETTCEAIYESALRFWLRKGVDGFRVDTAAIYIKDQSYPDGETGGRSGKYGDCSPYLKNSPRIHDVWKDIRARVLDPFGDRVTIGEIGGLPLDEVANFVSTDNRELSMTFDFDFTSLGGIGLPHENGGWTLPEMKTALQKAQTLATDPKTWASVFKENHDIPRSISRFGTTDPKYRDRSAKLLAIMMATLSGTLFLYQGEEIGMSNIPETWSMEDIKDVFAINYWNDMKEKYPNDKEMMRRVWLAIVATGRDNARTPVQWSAEHEAGFTTGTPWMRVNDNYKQINVDEQQGKNDSVLSFWKQILKLKREFVNAFTLGDFEMHDYENPKTFTFKKTASNGQVTVTVLNFTTDECEIDLPVKGKTKLLISNVEETGTKLQAWEGRVYLEV